MSVNVLGCQFDDSDEQVAEALETIIFHMNEDDDILYDYLACCEKFDVVPSTIEELASCVLSPDLNCYVQTNFDYPQGYPAEDIAYEDIGHYMLDETDLWNHLRKDHLDYYFDFEQYGHDYIQNNGSKLGAYGFLAAPPSSHIIISKDEIIELANYLSGAKYDEELIQSISEKVNTFALNDEVSPHINQERTNTPHDLTAEIQAARTAANKQETQNPQASLKYTRKQ